MTARQPLVTLTDTHLVLSQRAVLGLLSIFATLGVILACIGLNDAYTKVGGGSTREGTIITVAIVVAVTATVAAVGLTLVATRFNPVARMTRPRTHRDEN